MKQLLILLLLYLHHASGQIENGTAAEPGQFPYAVQVHRGRPTINYDEELPRGGESRRCTGVIIAANFALTAAHCVTRLTENSPYMEVHRDVWIVAGENLRPTAGERFSFAFRGTERRPDVIVPHELYPTDYIRIYDVAVMYFVDPLPVGRHNFIGSIRIASPIDEPLTGCRAMGWGNTRWRFSRVLVYGTQKERTELYGRVGYDKTAYDSPNRLLWGGVDVLSGPRGREVCHDAFNPFRHYCVVAGREGGLPLKGDSGGPLVCRARRKDGEEEDVVAGTVMYGDNGMYIIYSRLHTYKKWIMGVRQKLMANKRNIKETSRMLREMQWKEKEEMDRRRQERKRRKRERRKENRRRRREEQARRK